MAPYDIKAKQDLLVEDQDATESKKGEVANAVPAVYRNLDEGAVARL